jgi:antitoxin component of RelBE/YafQ-DinJ toxin-antitoxin module
MNTITMNVRVTKELKTSFEKAVQADGLDTSTAIRVLMMEYTKGKFGIGVRSKFDLEIAQGVQDYKNGKYVTAGTNKEIDKILDSTLC